MSWSSFKTFLTKDGHGNDTAYVKLLILFSYLSAAIPLGYGSWQLWQSSTYVERHCQVKFVEVMGPLRKGQWKPAWDITVLDEGNERTTKIDDKLILRSTYYLKSWALSVAQEKEINQIYPCYRHRNYPSLGTWGWQWDKPTKFKAYSVLSAFLLHLIFGSVLLILRKYYQRQKRRE